MHASYRCPTAFRRGNRSARHLANIVSSTVVRPNARSPTKARYTAQWPFLKCHSWLRRPLFGDGSLHGHVVSLIVQIRWFRRGRGGVPRVVPRACCSGASVASVVRVVVLAFGIMSSRGRRVMGAVAQVLVDQVTRGGARWCRPSQQCPKPPPPPPQPSRSRGASLRTRSQPRMALRASRLRPSRWQPCCRAPVARRGRRGRTRPMRVGLGGFARSSQFTRSA